MQSANRTTSSARVCDAQAGFSLIETLVALVVLSIGMLGIAALYVESLKAGQTAVLRTRAVTLAADMADRIRANQAGEASYVAAAAAAAAAPANNCFDTAVVIAANCTPVQLAADDIWQWKTLVGNSVDPDAQQLGLPQATATIARDPSTNPNTFTIVINWSEKTDALTYTLTVAI